MALISGKFKVMIGFNQYPMMAHIVYKDQVLKVNVSDLPCLLAIVKKAILKADQLSPTDEDKNQGNCL